MSRALALILLLGVAAAESDLPPPWDPTGAVSGVPLTGQITGEQLNALRERAALVDQMAPTWSAPEWSSIQGKPSLAPAEHTHPVAGIQATGTPSANTYLRGDGAWTFASTPGGTSEMPSCSPTLRGIYWTFFGAPGQADDTFVCRKGADDSYAWLKLSPDVATLAVAPASVSILTGATTTFATSPATSVAWTIDGTPGCGSACFSPATGSSTVFQGTSAAGTYTVTATPAVGDPVTSTLTVTAPVSTVSALAIDFSDETPGCASSGTAIDGVAVTTVRASPAAFVTATGVVQSCAANGLRLAPGGALIEGERVNRLARSRALDDAAWTKRGTTIVGANSVACGLAPDGTQTAEAITIGPDGSDVFQAPGGFTASAALAPSVWVKRISTAGVFGLYNAWGSANGRWDVDLAAIGSGWVRVERAGQQGVTQVQPWTATGDGNAGIQMYAYDPSIQACVWQAQQEEGAFPTSEIDTAGTAGTRAADVVTAPWPDVGTDTFCAAATVAPLGGAAWGAVDRGILAAGADAAANSLRVRATTAGALVFDLYDAAGAAKTLTVAAHGFAAGSEHRVMACTTAGELALYADGVALSGTPSGAGTGTWGAAPATLRIGPDLFGRVKSVAVCDALGDEGCTTTTEQQQGSAGAEFFVATTGSDSAAGTISAPFATLDRARDAVRALKSATGIPADGVAVTIRGGTYYRTSSLTLSSADSGTADDRRVTWRAYPGETVRISGGKAVTGWEQLTSADTAAWARVQTALKTGGAGGGSQVYRATISGVTNYGSVAQLLGGQAWEAQTIADPSTGGVGAQFRFYNETEWGGMAELFYDGAPMTLGRWPNDSATVSQQWVGATCVTGTPGPQTFTTSTVIPRTWSLAATGTDDRNRPWAHVNTNTWADNLVPIRSISGTTVTLGNAAGALNLSYGCYGGAGIWYATNLLEEVDAAGEYWIDRVAGVVYFLPPGGTPSGEAVVSALRTPVIHLDTTSSNITLQGLTVEAAQFTALVMDGTANALRHVTVRNAAGNGAIVGGAGHVVDNATFTGLGGGAIAATGTPANWNPDRPAAEALTVTNSEITKIGRLVFNYSGALNLSGKGSHVIRNNHIHDIPWCAVYVMSKNVTVERNVFQRTQLQGADNGTVYTYENLAANLLVRHNLFRDVKSSWPGSSMNALGVYLDTDHGTDKVTGVTVTANLFHKYGDGTGTKTFGGNANIAMFTKGQNNTFTNNLIAKTDLPFHNQFGGATTLTGNHGWSNANALPAGNESNLNPGFMDEAGGNFANRADGTLVLSNGTVIPFSSIGRNK